ncbi:MAG TPA: diguanylate cyclase [Rhizobacter sp.]|nr:diguanylate cyclase [Rhizobacter sp.]
MRTQTVEPSAGPRQSVSELNRAAAQARIAATRDLFLQRFVVVWLVLAAAVWLIGAVISPATQPPGIAMLVAGLATKLAIRAGRLVLARYLVVCIMSAFVLIVPAFLHGVRTTVLMGLSPAILMCAWLLGRRAAAVLTGISCVAVLFYWQADLQHWIDFGTAVRPPSVWTAAHVAVALVTGGTSWFLVHSFESGFHRLETLKEVLRASLAEKRALHDAIQAVPSYVYMKDTAGRYTYANKLVCDLFGRPLEDILGATDDWFFSSPGGGDQRVNDRHVLTQGMLIESVETNVIAATGETRHYWAVKSPLRSDAGEIIGLCGISTDVTDLQRARDDIERARQEAESANKALASAARFNEAILLQSPLPMGVYRADGQCVSVNDAFVALTGATREFLQAQNIFDLRALQGTGLLESCRAASAQNSPQRCEVQFMTQFGKQVDVDCRVLPTQLNEGEPHLLFQAIDLTERRRHEAELRQLAFNDALTHLPNRRMLLDRLAQALRVSKRQKSHGALLFLDLDKFKQLNDTHGHEAGDLLLVEVARRLKQGIRETDLVARLGGDEFVVLLEGLGPEETQAGAHAALIAEKIRQSLGEEYALGEIRYRSSASTGIRLFVGDADDADQIIKDADAAMYEAKKAHERLGFLEVQQ